jgi:hypothetical protein
MGSARPVSEDGSGDLSKMIQREDAKAQRYQTRQLAKVLIGKIMHGKFMTIQPDFASSCR